LRDARDLRKVEHGRNEVGAEVLFAIGPEFRNFPELLFTGGEEACAIAREYT
jgi:hypothetical protein